VGSAGIDAGPRRGGGAPAPTARPAGRSAGAALVAAAWAGRRRTTLGHKRRRACTAATNASGCRDLTGQALALRSSAARGSLGRPRRPARRRGCGAARGRRPLGGDFRAVLARSGSSSRTRSGRRTVRSSAMASSLPAASTVSGAPEASTACFGERGAEVGRAVRDDQQHHGGGAGGRWPGWSWRRGPCAGGIGTGGRWLGEGRRSSSSVWAGLGLISLLHGPWAGGRDPARHLG
jgi:hypothetical protein